MTLDCAVDVVRGQFHLSAAVAAPPGSVIALVGPNGAGKSTVMSALAGLVPMRGHVRIDGRDVAGLPPHRRGVGWVPQDGALFPHLSAQDNVAFGIGGRRGRSAAREWLDRVGLTGLADRRPGQLSGGQAQRVVLARALVRQPRLLLLDEPMAALDATARTDARRTLRQHLTTYDGVTLLVTHDPVDVATLASRVIALEDGRVVQDATPTEVARTPRTPWIATWMGLNSFSGRLTGHTVSLTQGGELHVADPAEPRAADVLAVVAAHAVVLSRVEPHGSARNSWPVTVRDLVSVGSRIRVHCDGPPGIVAEITPESVSELGLGEGVGAWASVKATEITVVPL